MKKSIIMYPIALLIIFFSNINMLFAQQIDKPALLGSITSRGSFNSSSGVLIAHGSNGKVYFANMNEVVVYEPVLSEMQRFAGTGEDGIISEGIAIQTPMTIQSIAVGPQDRLHILSESYIGRVDSDGMIDLLEFETDSGEITNKVPTIASNTPVSDIVFNESGELFILTSNGSDVGEVIYKVEDKKLTSYVGGGSLSLLDGNAENLHRLDVKLNDVSTVKIFENHILISIEHMNGNYIYKINASGNFELMANLSNPNFAPIINETLLIQSIPLSNTALTSDDLSRYSVSLHSSKEMKTIHLIKIPEIFNRIIHSLALSYDKQQDTAYIAVNDYGYYFLWAIPNVQSYTTTTINDWNYHE